MGQARGAKDVQLLMAKEKADPKPAHGCQARKKPGDIRTQQLASLVLPL